MLSMDVSSKSQSKQAEVAYSDVTGALGAFLLLHHCIVLDDRALLVDFQLEQEDDSVTVSDQYISQVLVRPRKYLVRLAPSSWTSQPGIYSK